MTMVTEARIYEYVKKHGAICKDPDWPNTFTIPNDRFDEILDYFHVSERSTAATHENGYWIISVGDFVVRKEDPDGISMKDLWKEMNEKDSAKSTDL